jgi:23S rRNA pseudouridine1911/1915/1917 synthase
MTVLADTPGQDDHHQEVLEFRPEREDKNTRLDRFIADALPGLSRTYLQSLIDEGLIQVDGLHRRAAFKMTAGQVVTVALPEIAEVEIVPEAIPLDVLFEDDDLLVLNKPAGMVVHPAPGHPTGTLVNAILHHAPGISIGGSNRPGIVHRLDKDTSGVMVVAKSDHAHGMLLEQWQRKSVGKHYTALVAGVVEEDEATIDAPIGRDPSNRLRMAPHRGGRDAVSHFTVEQRFDRCTLLDVLIETGRTHQIRVHLSMIGFPVVGDGLYGTNVSRALATEYGLKRQFLHASRLTLDMPNGERRTFTASLAPDLGACLEWIEGKDHEPHEG